MTIADTVRQFAYEYDILKEENQRLKAVVELLGEPGKKALERFPQYGSITVDNLVFQLEERTKELARRRSAEASFACFKKNLRELLQQSRVGHLPDESSQICFEDVQRIDLAKLKQLFELIKEN